MQVRVITRPPKRGFPARVRYASLVGPIPKSVRWSFLVFVGSIPLEFVPLSNSLSLTKLAGFMFFTCYLLSSGFPFRLSLPAIPAAMWGFIVYLLAYTLTGLMVEDERIRAYIVRLLSIVQLLVLFWLASELLADRDFAKKCLLTLAIACAILATATLLGLPGVTADVPQSGAPDRAAAFEFNPNTLGALMAYATIIILGMCLTETAWSGKRKLFFAGLTLPLLALMVQTGSRAAIGAFIIGMSFFFIPHRGSRRQMMAFFLGLAAIIGIVYLVVLNPVASERWTEAIQEGKTAGREKIYSAALEMIAERPVLGWGGREATEQLGIRVGTEGARDAHNLILYLLIEVGILGTIPFLIGLALCIRAAWRGRTSAFGLLPLALIMTVLAYSLTHTSLKSKVLWLFLGFAVAASSDRAVLRYRRVISTSGVKLQGRADRKLSPGIAPSTDS